MFQERRIRPQDIEFIFIDLADTFFQRSFPLTEQGYNQARKALIEQSKKVTPSLTTHEFVRRNSEKDFFRKFETGVAKALNEGEYALALENANQLYAYGDVDYQDFRGSNGIFDLSLKAHRALADNLQDRFSLKDKYLVENGAQFLEGLKTLRSKKGDISSNYYELNLLRRVIHRVALNWTLGYAARQQFDPFAVLRTK